MQRLSPVTSLLQRTAHRILSQKFFLLLVTKRSKLKSSRIFISNKNCYFVKLILIAFDRLYVLFDFILQMLKIQALQLAIFSFNFGTLASDSCLWFFSFAVSNWALIAASSLSLEACMFPVSSLSCAFSTSSKSFAPSNLAECWAFTVLSS